MAIHKNRSTGTQTLPSGSFTLSTLPNLVPPVLTIAIGTNAKFGY